ncbi:MAG: sensor histidine kinase [Planctomycetota bacterium]
MQNTPVPPIHGAEEAGQPHEVAICTTPWMARVRRWAGALLVAGGLLGGLSGALNTFLPLVVVGVAVLAYNVLIARALERVVSMDQPGMACPLFQTLADIGAVSVLVFFYGGVESPLAAFYVVLMVCAGIVLPLRLSLLLPTAAALLFGGMAVLQAAVPALYHPMPVGLEGHYFRNPAMVALVVGSVVAACYGTTLLSSVAGRRIQEHKQQVRRQRDVLHSVISSMSEGLLFISPRGRILLRNGAVSPLLGPGPAGDDPDPDELPEGLAEYIRRIEEAERPLPARSLHVTIPTEEGLPDGQYRAMAGAVRDQDGEHLGYVVVAEDVTEQLRVEEDLRARNREIVDMSQALQQNQQEMAQREKMVAVGTMAAGIAHEVGNPLASLSAVVQLLKRRVDGETEQRHLDTLEEQIERIAKIVRQMLEFSRPAASEWVETDLDDLIEQTVNMVSFTHRARHAEIRSVPNEELPEVRVMPQMLQQVLVNLLLNALDAVEGEPEPVVEIRRAVGDRWVSVTVEDRGVGMSEEQTRQAFEPFYTTKPPGKGTGLGLAVSYRLVERQGGRIKIESTEGEGTAVTVSFPIGEDDAPSGRTADTGVLST